MLEDPTIRQTALHYRVKY